MSHDLDPTLGQWYEDLDREETFQVVSVDPDEEIVRIQWLDREIEELDLDTWTELDLVLADEPEGWADDGEDIDVGDDDESVWAAIEEDQVEDDDCYVDDEDDDWDDGDDEEDEEDEDQDEGEAGGCDQAAESADHWRSLLRQGVNEELERLQQAEKRRAAIIEKRLVDRSAALQMLRDYFQQIGRETGVVVAPDHGPSLSYSVKIEADDEWLASVQIEEGPAEGSWRAVVSTGQVIRKVADLEEYLKTYLTRQLARRLALLHADWQQAERQAARIRERERVLAEESARRDAEMRARERMREFEARMLARSSSGAGKK